MCLLDICSAAAWPDTGSAILSAALVDPERSPAWYPRPSVKTPSVLQVVTSTDRRGAEVFAIDLERVLSARGWTIRTVALAPGVTRALDIPTLGAAPHDIGTILGLRSAANSVDVVVAHGSSTLFDSALALVASGVPFIYRNIGDPTYWSPRPVRRARTATMLSRAAAIAALSEGAARALRAHYRVRSERLSTIPTGVSAERFVPLTPQRRQQARASLGLASHERVVVTVGALSAEKGMDIAIEGIARSQDVDTLLIVGEGPERSALEHLARERAPGRVKFAGSVVDTSLAYSSADVAILASRTEGLPAALIEAGLSGIPTVATDVGFVSDIVLDGQTGVLVAPNDPASLARGIEMMLRKPNDFGQKARAHCLARFEMQAIADKWEDLLVRRFGTTR